MDDILKKLNLKKSLVSELENAVIIDTTFWQDKQVLEIMIQTPRSLSFDTFNILRKALIKHLKTSVRIKIIPNASELEFKDVMKYVEFIAHDLKLKKIHNVRFTLDDDTLTFLGRNDEMCAEIETEFPALLEGLKSVGLNGNLKTRCFTEEKTLKTVAKLPEPENIPQAQPKLQRVSKTHTKISDYTEITLKALTDEAKNIVVEGEIFHLDLRELNSGDVAVTYYLHDGEAAISINQYYKDSSEIIKKGSFVRLYGDYMYDNRTYIQDYVFKMKRYEMIEPLFVREDTAERKRVEFHLHTKISEMDGVSDVGDYIKQAYYWKHPGLVITDHEGVQSFPKAYNALKAIRKRDSDQQFKLGYGVEMNLTDKYLSIVMNPQQQVIQDATYVIFDLETTGLSAYYDHIIEFGAVKVVDGQTVDTIQMFVKPPVSIRPNITALTNISDGDVAKSKTIDLAIDEILNFIGDSVLVAHNASFDIDFLQETLLKLGRPPLNNTVIDTLDLARCLYDNRRSYRLGSIARLLKITYDDDVAHRADYDAEILSHVFFHMKRDPRIAALRTLDEIDTLQNEKSFSKTRKSHLSVVAKNQKGLKNLYELISLSYTTYLASFGASTKSAEFLAEPRIIRDEIIKRREDLLIGAGCSNSDLFEAAMNKGDNALERAISFYDYIEIMPLETFRHLVERNVIESQERLIEVIKRIVSMAKKCGKTIIVSGDAHYNHPQEKVIRDIYIHSQGIGGTRHPLYIYDDVKRMRFKTPEQHFRSTSEMLTLFDFLPNEEVFEYVVTNTNKLFEQIEEVSPIPEKLYTPSLENSDDNLRNIVYSNGYEMYGNPLPTLVSERVERELTSIIGHGFGVIYYISHLLVKKSLDDGYLVGSRGSVGSSLVATLSKITEVNPLPAHYVCSSCHYNEFFTEGQYSSGFDLPKKACPKCGTDLTRDGQDIPFETFLGFEGDKVPDIDLNFSGVYQEVAHAYTKELFGEEYVYRAGTISTVAQKTAFGYVKGYYESIQEPYANQAWSTYLSYGAEGVKRTTGQHPGGIIVIPNTMNVHDFTPVQFPANNPDSPWKTTHFEFHDIHDNVLKLDILGHVDPTAMKMLEKVSGIDIHDVPMNDPETLSLFASPQALKVDTRTYHEATGALGIPEFGTQFVRKMLEATRPDTFSDLVRISGLSHGTDVWRNNAETLIESGLTLKDVIGCRDDIMVYLMLHGLKPKLSFDIMESVRKGKGLNDAWKKEMKAHKIPSWYISSCEKIKYMFPKAHAVAYVMMAIRVAWFKVHHPLSYYAVYFTLRVNAYEIETMATQLDVVQRRLDDIKNRLKSYETQRDVTSKERSLVDTFEVTIEMISRGYHINPLDLNRSAATEFILDPDDKFGILPPFNTIDGLGDAVAQSIVLAREDTEFISKQDLMKRTGLSTTLVKKLDALGATKHLQETNQMSLF